MVEYYKVVEDGYIVGIGTKGPDVVAAITPEEYQQIMNVVHSAPPAPAGYEYKLRDADLQWELVELPPDPGPDPEEPDAQEILDILLGGEGE